MHKRSSQQVGRLGSVGGHGVDVAEAARACAAPGIGQNSTRAGAAEFWAMSGAATKLPPKKLLQRHAGPSQRAAGQLLWRCAPCGLRKRAKTQLDLRSLRRDSSLCPKRLKRGRSPLTTGSRLLTIPEDRWFAPRTPANSRHSRRRRLVASQSSSTSAFQTRVLLVPAHPRRRRAYRDEWRRSAA